LGGSIGSGPFVGYVVSDPGIACGNARAGCGVQPGLERGNGCFQQRQKESQRYKNRALSAQSRYSSALIEQSEKSDEMRQHEGSINSAVMELDKELAGKAARGGAK